MRARILALLLVLGMGIGTLGSIASAHPTPHSPALPVWCCRDHDCRSPTPYWPYPRVPTPYCVAHP